MQERIEQQSIPVKMYRSSDRLDIAAPMAGVEPSDVTVEITPDNRILLYGDLRGVLKGEKELLIGEWNVGNYYLELELPVSVDGEMANVTYRNGVLVVNLPIAKQTRPARLTLDRVGEAHGERVGNAGHPPHSAHAAQRPAGR